MPFLDISYPYTTKPIIMKNLSFKHLVSKMDNIEETEQGKIKGGIVSLPSNASINVAGGGNIRCWPLGQGTNLSACGPPKAH